MKSVKIITNCSFWLLWPIRDQMRRVCIEFAVKRLFGGTVCLEEIIMEKMQLLLQMKWKPVNNSKQKSKLYALVSSFGRSISKELNCLCIFLLINKKEELGLAHPREKSKLRSWRKLSLSIKNIITNCALWFFFRSKTVLTTFFLEKFNFEKVVTLSPIDKIWFLFPWKLTWERIYSPLISLCDCFGQSVTHDRLRPLDSLFLYEFSFQLLAWYIRRKKNQSNV